MVERVLGQRVVDPSVTLTVRSSWWTSRQNATSGGIYKVFNVRVSTNAPDVVLGRLSLLRDASTIGFNGLYLSGYVDAVLATSYPDLADEIAVELDVIAEEHVSRIDHPRYLSLTSAIESGLVEPDSPMASYSRKYGLGRVALYGPGLIGPSTEMIAALETIWPIVSPLLVADVCSGTGALGAVCLNLGARRVISVDSAPPSAERLNPTDLFCLQLAESVDLLILDQFVEQTIQVAKIFLPSVARSTQYVLWNLGFSAHESLYAELESGLAPWYMVYQKLLVNDCHIVLLYSHNRKQHGTHQC